MLATEMTYSICIDLHRRLEHARVALNIPHHVDVLLFRDRHAAPELLRTAVCTRRAEDAGAFVR